MNSKKREQPPFAERFHRQPAESAAAAPEREEAHFYAMGLHSDDFALQKRFRVLRKRGEEVGDDGRFGRQGPSNLVLPTSFGQADCAPPPVIVSAPFPAGLHESCRFVIY